MSNQAQVDALEQLLMAVLKNNSATLMTRKVFEDARARVMGSEGPPGTEQKTNAHSYLEALQSSLSR
ncbi:hypothetical protein [Metapseudomonas otitidis]|jgi:hypothetical protein|uniref:hypothetical protein n=1 Tax=Metapseudomonas otitidis TaxID=319939 RepID=UPI0020985D0C|nr:hypothetical protein [Pseudomonas otitidis]MCO7555098.1 hypothetical protein [Pseudomonas otitidis]